jgi:UDP-N-acetylmuramyl pentapeptide synthase
MSHPLSAELLLENRLRTDCGRGSDWRKRGSVRTIMNQELQAVENKKVGQRLTKSSGFFVLRPFSCDCDNFSLDVAETGASAALVSDPPRAINSLRDLSLLQVQDTLTTLHKLAPSYRQLMPFRPLWN